MCRTSRDVGTCRSHPDPEEPGDMDVAGLFTFRNAPQGDQDFVVKFQIELDVAPLASRVITFQ
jgi:hypothetical protein